MLLVYVAYLRDPLAEGLNVYPLHLLIALGFPTLSDIFTAALIIVAHDLLRPVYGTFISLKLSGVCDLQCQLRADPAILPDEALNLLAKEA